VEEVVMVDCFDLCQCRVCGTYYWPDPDGELCRRCSELTPKQGEYVPLGQIIDLEV
jgi:hypothetical protein